MFSIWPPPLCGWGHAAPPRGGSDSSSRTPSSSPTTSSWVDRHIRNLDDLMRGVQSENLILRSVTKLSVHTDRIFTFTLVFHSHWCHCGFTYNDFHMMISHIESTHRIHIPNPHIEFSYRVLRCRFRGSQCGLI